MVWICLYWSHPWPWQIDTNVENSTLYKNSHSFSREKRGCAVPKQPASFREQEANWIHRFSSSNVSRYLSDAASGFLCALQLPLQAARFWGWFAWTALPSLLLLLLRPQTFVPLRSKAPPALRAEGHFSAPRWCVGPFFGKRRMRNAVLIMSH